MSGGKGETSSYFQQLCSDELRGKKKKKSSGIKALITIESSQEMHCFEGTVYSSASGSMLVNCQ